MVVRSGSQPVLAAAGDSQITLFGGARNRADVAYAGRSRGAMLQHSFAREGADFDLNLSSDGGRFVFASTRHSETPDLYVKAVDGIAVMQLTSDPGSDIHPSFSPDNRQVAFASNRTGNWDIWIIDIEGQHPIQVTNTPMDEVHPSWSPDGRQLVCSALPRNSGQWELWVAPARENAPRTFIGYGVFPEWSPVDNTILFQRARRRGTHWYSIWTVKLIDGQPRYPTEVASSADHALISPAWDREGQRIAYTTVAGLTRIDPEFGSAYEVSDIWIIDIDGGTRVRLTDGHTANYAPAWSSDGRVYFTSARSGSDNIWSVMPSIGSAPTGMGDVPGTISQGHQHGNQEPPATRATTVSSDGS